MPARHGLSTLYCQNTPVRIHPSDNTRLSIKNPPKRVRIRLSTKAGPNLRRPVCFSVQPAMASVEGGLPWTWSTRKTSCPVRSPALLRYGKGADRHVGTSDSFPVHAVRTYGTGCYHVNRLHVLSKGHSARPLFYCTVWTNDCSDTGATP